MKFAAAALFFLGLNATNALGQFPDNYSMSAPDSRQIDRNDIWVVDTGDGVWIVDTGAGVWVVDTGVGLTDVEMEYLMLLQEGYSEEEATFRLLGESAGEGDPEPSKVKKPTFGPHMVTFDN